MHGAHQAHAPRLLARARRWAPRSRRQRDRRRTVAPLRPRLARARRRSCGSATARPSLAERCTEPVSERPGSPITKRQRHRRPRTHGLSMPVEPRVSSRAATCSRADCEPATRRSLLEKTLTVDEARSMRARERLRPPHRRQRSSHSGDRAPRPRWHSTHASGESAGAGRGANPTANQLRGELGYAARASSKRSRVAGSACAATLGPNPGSTSVGMLEQGSKLRCDARRSTASSPSDRPPSMCAHQLRGQVFSIAGTHARCPQHPEQRRSRSGRRARDGLPTPAGDRPDGSRMRCRRPARTRLDVEARDQSLGDALIRRDARLRPVTAARHGAPRVDSRAVYFPPVAIGLRCARGQRDGAHREGPLRARRLPAWRPSRSTTPTRATRSRRSCSAV